MGSKRKSKEEKIKDEGRSKRHRTSEDEESEDQSRREKRHKHRSDKENERKRKEKHKGDSHKRDRHSKHDIQELSSEDYFLKNNEFSTWLKEEKDIFFSELSSESSRKLFQDFIEAWNNQDLEPKYYEGITKGPRTSHNWKIKK